MTRVGGTPPAGPDRLQAQEQMEQTRARDRERQFGQKSSLGDGLRREMRFGQWSLGTETQERGVAFHDKVQHALRQTRHGETDKDEAGERSRLLAVAGEALNRSPASAALPAPSLAPDSSAERADRGLRIDTLAQRIEVAMGAELRRGRGEELSLRLDLGGEGVGLASVTVAMTADRLDIVLSADGAALPPEIAMAAQALADRLHQRFRHRIVRVHEAEPASQAESEGMETIFRLFRSADDVS